MSFVSDLLETNPDQDGTANMITDDPGFPALAAFDPGQLFGFAVKLLDLPAQAAHFLYDLRVVLSQVVRHDIVRALGRQHHSEEFHLISTRKAFDLDQFAMFLFTLGPRQRIHSPIRLGTARIIDLAVILERTVEDLVEPIDRQHHLLGGVPAVHQHRPELQELLVDTVHQHLVRMLQLGLAVSLRIIDAIINDPELVQDRVDIHAGDHPDPFDHLMRIPAVLLPHQFDRLREVFVNHRVDKDQKPFRRLLDLTFDILPDQVRSDLVPGQIAVDRIMTELLRMFGKVRQRIINLADQQVLTIIQACDRVAFGSHHSLPYPFPLSLSINSYSA